MITRREFSELFLEEALDGGQRRLIRLLREIRIAVVEAEGRGGRQRILAVPGRGDLDHPVLNLAQTGQVLLLLGYRFVAFGDLRGEEVNVALDLRERLANLRGVEAIGGHAG